MRSGCRRSTRPTRRIAPPPDGRSWAPPTAASTRLTYAEVFGAVGIQSPSFWRSRWVLDRLAAAKSYPPRVFLDVGLYERWALADAHELARILRGLEVKLLYLEVPDGHSWGHWRATIDDLLLFFYGREAPAAGSGEPAG